jgi:hypothetical protein
MQDVKIQEPAKFNSGITSVLIPTRGRLSALVSMMQSCLDMAESPAKIQFCLYIDRDDDSYNLDTLKKITSDILVLRGPRMSLSLMFNSLLTIATGEFFFWSGDDVIFKTKNWDGELQKSILRWSDKLGVAYANDMADYPQLYATIGMVHYEWVSLFGYLFTPHMKDNGIDFWISEVARRGNRLSLCENVKIDHRQYRQGKSSFDSTYADRRNDHQTYDVLELYRVLKFQRRRDAVVLLQATNQKVRFERGFSISWILFKLRTYFDKEFYSSRRSISLNSMSDKTIFRKMLVRMHLVRQTVVLPPKLKSNSHHRRILARPNHLYE